MFKKVTKIALAGIIGVGTLVGSSSMVLAADPQPYDSKANVFFKENEEMTNPTNPNTPGQEVTPTPDSEGGDPINDGTAGPLSIDYASHINFTEVNITSQEQTYTAKPISFQEGGESAPYVQVTDNRGTKTGWDLQVTQLGAFTHETDTSTLEGAKLSLKNGDVKSTLSTEGVTAKDVEFDQPNIAYSVMEATTGNGAGTFTNKFGEIVEGKATDVTLFVPAESVISEGKYTTTLEWQMVTAP